MRDKLRFIHRGEIVELENIDPTETLLNYLRYKMALTGTKEGCAEGDCGACTVVLGDLQGGTLRYQAVNACIQFLPMLDGKELITVEDLKSPDGTPHPVQKAVVAANGTQCGFCTPGFVMSIFAEMHTSQTPDRGHIDNILAGNLCRCTGYGPLIQAAEDIARADVRDQFHARAQATAQQLQVLQKDESLSLTAKNRYYFAPKTVEELTALLARFPEATILAGATDVGLWVTKQHRDLVCVIHIGQIGELRQIAEEKGQLCIGAGVSYSEAWSQLAGYYPDFGELIRRLASTQIRNSGTIGGNIANGSPIGDTPPALIALDTKLRLRSAAGIRDMALEDFFIAYGKQDIKHGEFVEKIFVPLPDGKSRFATYKLSKRFDQDISAVCAAFRLTLDGPNVKDVRICYGGMAGTPARAGKTEKALIGTEWSIASVEAALPIMAEDYRPMSDMRASREYRLLIAQNLLKKFAIETTTPEFATRIVGAGGLAYA